MRLYTHMPIGQYLHPDQRTETIADGHDTYKFERFELILHT